MKYLSKVKLSIGFIFVLSIVVVMVIGFSAGVVKAKHFSAPNFDPDNFPVPPDINVINNPFMTLIPGTAFCYEAETEDGTEINQVTVTKNCSQVIAGVNTIAIRDTVELNGDLTEDTYDFFAQDDDGNVWYLGEATEECEDNNTEGTWNADEPGAEPGIVMLADPMPGNSYRQEFLEDVAEDMAKVLRLNASVSVPYGDFEGCLKTKEWTPLERGDVEHKYYALDIAPDIGGLVLTEELKGKTVRSELFDVLDVIDTGYCPLNLQDALAKLCVSAPPMNCE